MDLPFPTHFYSEINAFLSVHISGRRQNLNECTGWTIFLLVICLYGAITKMFKNFPIMQTERAASIKLEEKQWMRQESTHWNIGKKCTLNATTLAVHLLRVQQAETQQKILITLSSVHLYGYCIYAIAKEKLVLYFIDVYIYMYVSYQKKKLCLNSNWLIAAQCDNSLFCYESGKVLFGRSGGRFLRILVEKNSQTNQYNTYDVILPF